MSFVRGSALASWLNVRPAAPMNIGEQMERSVKINTITGVQFIEVPAPDQREFFLRLQLGPEYAESCVSGEINAHAVSVGKGRYDQWWTVEENQHSDPVPAGVEYVLQRLGQYMDITIGHYCSEQAGSIDITTGWCFKPIRQPESFIRYLSGKLRRWAYDGLCRRRYGDGNAQLACRFELGSLNRACVGEIWEARFALEHTTFGWRKKFEPEEIGQMLDEQIRVICEQRYRVVQKVTRRLAARYGLKSTDDSCEAHLALCDQVSEQLLIF